MVMDQDCAATNAAAVSCTHVKKALDLPKLRKALKTEGIRQDCTQCLKQRDEKGSAASNPDFPYDKTLWMCLKCGAQLCGNVSKNHAMLHFQVPRSDLHCLAMHVSTLEVWCYECQREVTTDLSSNEISSVGDLIKKATKTPNNPHPVIELPAPPAKEMESLTNGTAAYDKRYNVTNFEEGAFGTTELKTCPTAPPPPPPPIPGMAKRISAAAVPPTLTLTLRSPPASSNFSNEAQKVVDLRSLPRVRGLVNLGNTCFFNAVMQCLAQTPFLLDVLRELSESGEQFTLPGGSYSWNGADTELPMIKGTLSSWGGLTAALANTLEELQSGGGVFNPGKLFEKLCNKCPQFRGGDQHDSHELLRQLLESVRSEDLKRYQSVILQNLGWNQGSTEISDELRLKCKIYGNQAADRILRPDQVFRGFLVSTLTCQECYNVSSRHEYFLDISLPVSVENIRPAPLRRRTSPDMSIFKRDSPSNCKLSPDDSAPTPLFFSDSPTVSKSKLEREKERERKAKRAQKHHNKRKHQQMLFSSASPNEAAGEEVVAEEEQKDSSPTAAKSRSSSTSNSCDTSDADVEDNLLDDGTSIASMAVDTNGNSATTESSINNTSAAHMPANIEKDSLDEEDDEHDSGIATSPANNGSALLSSEVSTDGSSVTATNSVLSLGLSEKGANLMRQLSLGDVGEDVCNMRVDLEHLKLNGEKQTERRSRRVRTQSHSDWVTTIAPRYECEEGECSVLSCLNNFTAVELMSGSNQVGCENCTKRINGDDPKAKTVCTNATKQFLISSPPAVLILHLKRFQLTQRCIFRKLTRSVNFDMVFDLAPFCGSKVKNLPNIDRKQKKLLYALYGIVEHSGNMYGGHYTAYVKVRPKLAADDKRWKFMPQGSKAELDQADEQRMKLEELLAKEKARELRLKAIDDSDDFSTSSSNSSAEDEREGIEAGVGADSSGQAEEAIDVEVPQGKWYYVSDSHVQEVAEEEVLRAQAYLLFYERIY